MSEQVKREEAGVVSRREFLKLAGVAGATIGVAGGLGGLLAACGGEEQITTTTAGATDTTAGVTTTAASTETTAAEAVPEEVVIGYTTAQSGPVGPFALMMEPGVEWAVGKWNDAGGVTIGGQKVPVKVVKLDNKSDPTTSGNNAKQLILQNKAVALLSAISPGVDVAAENVAEQMGIPLMLLCDPVQSTLANFPNGLKWSYISMFDEKVMTDYVYKAAALANTNGKVAIITDTETDGTIMGDYWEQYAGQNNFQVVLRSDNQPMTTDFSTAIKDAQSKGAEIVVGCMIGPDGIALLKQMKALGYSPKFIDIEKAGADNSFYEALGDIGMGLCDTSSPTPYMKSPDLAFISEKSKALHPDGWTVSGCFLEMESHGYSQTMALLDAIDRAGSTEPKAIQTALNATNKDFSFGTVQYVDNIYSYPTVVTQHFMYDAPMVWGPGDLIKQAIAIKAPMPGLAG